jgi:REP element-mobilizing transposase RayT
MNDPNFRKLPQRKSLRLKGYDYSLTGGYFVTLCTKGREAIFGTVIADQMHLNELGEIVLKCWKDLPRHYSNVELDEFVVMPNHVHGVVMLRAGLKPAPTSNRKTHGLPEIVRAFKTFSSRRINVLRKIPLSVWQRAYYEHIIRNDDELHAIRKYIQNNPLSWQFDELNKNFTPNTAGARPCAPTDDSKNAESKGGRSCVA